MKEPYSRGEVRKIIVSILGTGGSIMFVKPHCEDRMEQRNISAAQVHAVIRGGAQVGEPEYSEKSAAWRYCMEKLVFTPKGMQNLETPLELNVEANRITVVTAIWRRR